ncbi:NtrZ family periplasmic regulatory protein [Phenylobacterium sp.]|uniref:NtrZ family periplasmic regulatory protein n=1 Tax=Phenylobacterium sp. TaxID=1871053 RepID=UPI0025DBDC59|nr:hypothetical protein [Phenylobacterium sp.]MBX3482921.1 hypothetical protein [Phenylobacterium sp.]MCW5759162.1 hypothetical protein [Phenylobacterium sp.]
MTTLRLSAALVAAVLMSTVGGAAYAADKGKPVDFTVQSEPTTAAPNGGRSYTYDASKGRLGFTLRMQQPDNREATPNDVQAGAYFRITPSIRVGGSVALGDQQLTPRANQARPADAPKLRLESTLKF